MVNAVYSSAGFTFDVATETAYNSGTKLADLGELGIMTKFSSYELDNAFTEAYQIGQRIPEAFYTQGLKAQIGLDFYMCQDQVGWLAFVMGAATGGTYTVGNTIQTGQVQLGTPQGDIFTIGGIAFNTADINIQTGQAVQVSLRGVGSSFSTVAGTLVAGAIPTTLLTWKDCNLTSGVTTSLVESLKLTIDTGAKQFYALGSAQYQTYLPLESKITAEVQAFHNDTALDVLYQLTTAGTVSVAIGTHTATFTGCYLTKGSLDLEPVKEALNTIDFSATQVTFT